MSFATYLVLFLALVASSDALATPHVVRHVAHHHAIAARIAVPEPLALALSSLGKRATRKRCKQRPIQSSSIVVTPSPAPVANAAPLPSPSPSTTSQRHAPSPSPAIPRPSPVTTTPKPAAPAPTRPTANLPSFMVGTQTGQGTFYATGLGACGIVNKDTDFIAAASHLLFDNFPGYNGGNPNKNPMCGRTVTATYKGKSVTVALTDRCEGCAVTDLDFSPSAFNQIAAFELGRISGMTWSWDD